MVMVGMVGDGEDGYADGEDGYGDDDNGYGAGLIMVMVFGWGNDG